MAGVDLARWCVVSGAEKIMMQDSAARDGAGCSLQLTAFAVSFDRPKQIWE